MDEDERKRCFETIYAAHLDALGFALRRADPETAREAVAETFTVAWRRFGEIPDEPIAWLLGVTRKTLAGRRRARRRYEALTDHASASMPTAGPMSADHATAIVERSAITAALRQLSVTDQETLTLIAWEGLTASEASQVLGCSTATFNVRLHRARQRFRTAHANEQACTEASPMESNLTRTIPGTPPAPVMSLEGI